MPRLLLRPFPWALLGHLCLGIVLAPLLAAALGLIALTVPLAVFTPKPFLWLVRDVPALAAFDRARFEVLAGRRVGRPLPELPGDLSPHDRVRWVLAEPQHQGAAGYVLVRLGLALVEAIALFLVVVVPLIVGASIVLALGLGYEPRGARVVTNVSPSLVAAVGWLGALTVVVCVVAPAVIRGLAWLDTRITLTLLGQQADALERRVGELVAARARTVSAADAERAKLERDLHDGAQQRLIALSVLLGQAESRLAEATPGEGTLELVRRARAETAGTIDELRTLTRGLRPPILGARGLDAALSAVASRLPMPVLIDVRLAGRPDPAREALLYFAVTELLTNVAKHGGGAPASVEVRQNDRSIRVTVTDGGNGGADVARGTGLRGLADRLSGVDGRLFLSSPVGGPTVVTLEVPCA